MADPHGVPNAAKDIARYIDRGQRLSLVDGDLTRCIGIEAIEDRPFDVGFDFEASLKTRKIVGVDPDGPAYVLGIRDGQILRSINVTRRTDTPATVGVQDTKDDPVRVVEYLPLGKPVRRQHVALRSDLTPTDRVGCVGERAGASP